jgi:TPP-dependent pyruvate/acetoin dehydrogenase alpha subunit
VPALQGHVVAQEADAQGKSAMIWPPTKQALIGFEQAVAELFAEGKIRGPVHLSGGNEEPLINIFKLIDRQDYVFSTWRNHYHALLHGISPEWLMQEILAGHSMNLMNHEHRFFTSAIVGGTLSIAVGVAAALKRSGSTRKVWCFIGDMAATTGAFHEARAYAEGNDLPIVFIIESNGFSTDSPTSKCWGIAPSLRMSHMIIHYNYDRTYPHVNIDKFVHF